MSKGSNKKILIVCGEASGERNAAQLVRELKKMRADIDFYAVGGEACRAEGVEILHDIKDLGIVGIGTAFRKFPVVLEVRKKLIDFVKAHRPDLIIPVDFPDFNLSLLNRLKRYRIPVCYFISPQVWAWRKGRIRKIKRLVDKMLVLLPFEKDIYEKAGVPAVYVGNPAVERVKVDKSPEEFRKSYGIPVDTELITFLPGSRFHEIEDIMPIMLRSIPLLREGGKFSFVFAPSTSVDIDKVKSLIDEFGKNGDIYLAPGDPWNAAAASKVVITKSGTSTVEIALVGTPFITVYKTSAFAYVLVKIFYGDNNVALANIIGGGSAIPELIQDDFTPENLFNSVISIINDSKKRQDIIEYLGLIRGKLGSGGAAKKAAEAVVEML
jgi:lipid-A-disaccharide synthase